MAEATTSTPRSRQQVSPEEVEQALLRAKTGEELMEALKLEFPKPSPELSLSNGVLRIEQLGVSRQQIDSGTALQMLKAIGTWASRNQVPIAAKVASEKRTNITVRLHLFGEAGFDLREGEMRLDPQPLPERALDPETAREVPAESEPLSKDADQLAAEVIPPTGVVDLTGTPATPTAPDLIKQLVAAVDDDLANEVLRLALTAAPSAVRRRPAELKTRAHDFSAVLPDLVLVKENVRGWAQGQVNDNGQPRWLQAARVVAAERRLAGDEAARQLLEPFRSVLGQDGYDGIMKRSEIPDQSVERFVAEDKEVARRRLEQVKLATVAQLRPLVDYVTRAGLAVAAAREVGRQQELLSIAPASERPRGDSARHSPRRRAPEPPNGGLQDLGTYGDLVTNLQNVYAQELRDRQLDGNELSEKLRRRLDPWAQLSAAKTAPERERLALTLGSYVALTGAADTVALEQGPAVQVEAPEQQGSLVFDPSG